MFHRAAPVFAVRDVDAALAFYATLGSTFGHTHENAMVDPDDNVIRFGSPIR
jgi:catechol 2,3-dioxygenase-like lactoylglutathione lyase family enzyme